jgi:signal transduction histidine kinase
VFRFRRIRSKLVFAFAVPVVILVVVAGLEVVSSVRQIDSVDQQTNLASASVGPGGLVQDLQNEREDAVLSVLAAGADLPTSLKGITPESAGLYTSPASFKDATNAALTSFETTITHAGRQALADYYGAFATLKSLGSARSLWAKLGAAGTVTNYRVLATQVFDQYTTIINALVNATSAVPLQVSDPTLRTGVEALDASLNITEAEWQVVQDLFIASWTPVTQMGPAANQATLDFGTVQAWAQRLTDLGKGSYSDAVDVLISSTVPESLQLDVEVVQQGIFPSMPTLIQAFSQPAPIAFSGQKGTSSSTTTTSATVWGNNAIATVVARRASQLHSNAVRQAGEFGILALAATLLGLLLVALVSRSISKPLISLARQAEQLAHETLPAAVETILEGSGGAHAPPVKVTTRDEVSDVARALDAVNKTAIELAGGQAALRRNLADAFVNLGRRNQNLVTRQLEYISEIELKEGDPESLEELFRLDHLATRMRRNAESLLILAGSGPARPWSAPVAAVDVVRAASAEVEDYQRLRLHHFDGAFVTGAATTDLVHILAELMENALQFSPPGSPVDIYGRLLDEGYVIAIVDAGIGMSTDELEVANRRLQGEDSSGSVPGRFLGHFVAGRLASRLGITASLQKSQSGGLVARVKVPGTALEEPVADLSADAETTAPSAPASYAMPSTVPTERSSGAPASPPPVRNHSAPPATDHVSAPPQHGLPPLSSRQPPAPSTPAWAPSPVAEPAETDFPVEAEADVDFPVEAEADFPAEADFLAEADLPDQDQVAAQAAMPAQDEDEFPEELAFGEAPAADDEPVVVEGSPVLEDEPVAQADDEPALQDDLPAFEFDEPFFSPMSPSASDSPPELGTGPVIAWDSDGPGVRNWDEPAADGDALQPDSARFGAPERALYGHDDPEANDYPLSAAQVFDEEAFAQAAPSPTDKASEPDGWAQAWDPFATGTSPWDGLDEPLQADPVELAPSPPKARASAPAASNGHGVDAPALRPSPDLGSARDLLPTKQRAQSPAPSAPAPSATSAHRNGAAPAAATAVLGPAAQAASTAAGLRRLTRRVPGASLTEDDSSLRRTTPTTTTRNPLGLTAALSQYLSAAAPEIRPEKEH